jgi:hypothetical protein
MVRTCLGVGLAVAIVSAAAPAAAQVRRHDGYYGARASYGFDNGYRQGLSEGERDARQRQRFDYNDSNQYRRADRGYDRRSGDLDGYRREFRRGFEAGYRDGYQRAGNGRGGYGPYGNSGGRGNSRGGYGYPGGYGSPYGYASPAAQYGFNEGYEKGLEDLRDGDRYEPARHKWYREGDRHYNSRYGSRDAYKNEYRLAFREGYDRAFREGRYRY